MESINNLVRGLTLVYRETNIEDLTDATKEIITELCAKVKLPNSVELDPSRDIARALKSLLERLVGDNLKKGELDSHTLLQEFKLAADGRDDLIETLTTSLEPIPDADREKRIRNKLRSDIKKELNFTELMVRVRKFASTMRVKTSYNYLEDAQEFMTYLEEIVKDAGSDGAHRGSQSVNLNDIDKLTEYFELSKSDDNPKLFLKCGWEWMTEMLGEPAAFRRGDMVGVYALQHNFKSGFVNNIGRQFVQFNPNFVCMDETKKPLLIMMTTENHLQENLKGLYRQIYENETNQECDLKNVTTREMAEYINKWKEAKGWEVVMVRENPSDFTFRDLTALVERYEAEGYEVVSMIVDYLAMISTKGCYTGIGGATGMDIRALFRRTRNYMAAKHILFITPHQLSTRAKAKREEYDDAVFLENIVDKGMFDSCGTIDQEFDMEIYVHIVKRNGEKYLMIHRGKHRGVDHTPEIHMKKIVPFQKIASIPDDLGASRAITKIPGTGGAVEEW